MLGPLAGNLRTAYEQYNLPTGRISSDQTLTRDETMPIHTHCTGMFEGTLDHLIYNEDELKVVSVLEVYDSRTIPNISFPSDHLRIEAIFQFTN